MRDRTLHAVRREAPRFALAVITGGVLVVMLWAARPSALAAGRPVEDIWAILILGLCPPSFLLTSPSDAQTGSIAANIRTLAFFNSALYAIGFAFVRLVQLRAQRLAWILPAMGVIWTAVAVWICLSWR